MCLYPCSLDRVLSNTSPNILYFQFLFLDFFHMVVCLLVIVLVSSKLSGNQKPLLIFKKKNQADQDWVGIVVYCTLG